MIRNCIVVAVIFILLYYIINKALSFITTYISADTSFRGKIDQKKWFYPKEGRKSYSEFYKFSNVKPFQKEVERNKIFGYKNINSISNESFKYNYPSKNIRNGADYIGTNNNIYTQENLPELEDDIITQKQVEEESKKNYENIDVVPNISFLDIDKFLSSYT